MKKFLKSDERIVFPADLFLKYFQIGSCPGGLLRNFVPTRPLPLRDPEFPVSHVGIFLKIGTS